jgi:uncharacterized heparinase superfamily protein
VKKYLLYFNTIRHLKYIQVFYRLKRIFRPKTINIQSQLLELRPKQASWYGCSLRDAKMIGPDQFRFLNLDGTIDWNDDSKSRLWLYNLHYFDDLNAIDAPERLNWHLKLIDNWIDQNPIGHGVGWEPYTLSLRIVNWIKWSLGGGALSDKALISLSSQVKFLERNIEYHILGNHLFANAKALLFAGLFFEGDDPRRWMALGWKIIEAELQEQVLSDGGHFELSPMYHNLFLEDCLDIVNLKRCYADKFGINHLSEKILIMLAWSKRMSHPDGHVSFFNDSSFKIALSWEELSEYAHKMGINVAVQSQSSLLVDSGYITAKLEEAYIIADVAKVGPDYLPGHAHADNLSFEFSLFNQRIIVNSGTSCYQGDSRRDWERSTAAHSTVEVDGKNSSEVWSSFRVARRAYPHDIFFTEQEDLISFGGSHNGYKTIMNGPTHSREWIISSNKLEIKDVLTGQYQFAVARYYLHPSVTVELDRDNAILIFDDKVINVRAFNGNMSVVDSYFSPEFGKLVPNKCLEVSINSNQSGLELSWDY